MFLLSRLGINESVLPGSNRVLRRAALFGAGGSGVWVTSRNAQMPKKEKTVSSLKHGSERTSVLETARLVFVVVVYCCCYGEGLLCLTCEQTSHLIEARQREQFGANFTSVLWVQVTARAGAAGAAQTEASGPVSRGKDGCVTVTVRAKPGSKHSVITGELLTPATGRRLHLRP